MYQAYRDPEDVIRALTPAINRGRFKLLIFILAGEYNSQILHEVSMLQTDIDALTGHFAAVVAFMPPPDARPQPMFLWSIRNSPIPSEGDPDWQEYVSQMTRATYDLALHFGIDSTSLPCLLFLVPGNTDEFAVLSLRGETLHDVYRQLMTVFLTWRSEEKKTVIGYSELCALADESDHSLPWEQSNEAKRFVEQAYRHHIVPLVLDALRQAVVEAGIGKNRLNRLSSDLKSQPKNLKPITDFLQANRLSLRVGNKVIGPEFFKHHYQMLYDDLVGASAREVLRTSSAAFPLDLERKISRKTEIRSWTTRAGRAGEVGIKGLGWAKTIMELWSKLMT